ncbi:MAG TPA: autotransporter domain-containing protein, partial [Pedomonas sp.]|uniref:autotransporter outer membrane beta-barrel domain-containing protein n=1 Tax=Pedomonas sp. TaxID=2976421 RepID=UPI002F410F2E
GFAATIEAALTGSSQLVKTDLGTLVLTGANSYTGGTMVEAGTLRAGTANAFVQNGSYIVNGGTLDLNGHALTMASLSGSGGTVALGAASLTVAQNTDTVFAGGLTGSGSLTKQGSGTLTMTGANSYTGNTVVEAGTLRAGTANAFVQNGSYVVNGGTLDLNGHALTMAALSGAGGSIALGAASLTVAQNTDTVFAGSLTGAGSLTKQGSGTLTLTGANSYTGGTVVQAGTLRAGTANAFVQNGSYTVNGGALDLNGHALTMASLSGSGGTVALGAASLTVAQNTDTTFAGGLTGSGSLTKQGSGTLTLTGANSYAGGTIVKDGTLRAGIASAFVQNGSYIVNGGTLDLNGHALTMGSLSGTGGTLALGAASLTIAQNTDTSFAGSLAGSGSLTKQGSGTLILTGDNSGFAGMVRLAGGHMVVGKTGAGSLGGTLQLNGGSRLSGSGTVGSTVVGDKAVLAPGNSIGTLTVKGDLTLSSGSLYEVESDPAGAASDRVHVTGKIRLEGGTVLHVGEEGEYRPFARYTILTAGGGIEGTFGGALSKFAFLTPTLSYTAREVSLELTRNTAKFQDKVVTRNQLATATAAERLGAGHAVYDAILTLPDDAARVQHSFDLLSGEIHASARSVLIEDSRFVREAVSQQLRSGSGGGLWGQTFSGWGSRSGNGNAARLTHNTQGILLGWDVALGDGSAGLVAGYGNADLTVGQRLSSSEAESYHLGFYWGARLGSISLRGGAAYSWHDLETRRDVTVAALSQNVRAEYKAASVQAFAEAAWAVHLGKAALEPFASLAHVINTVESFGETGGTAALSGSGKDLAVTFGTLGFNARLGFDLGSLPASVHGSFGWQHAFSVTAPTSRHGFPGGDLFAVVGSPLAQDVARLQTGVQLDVSERASLGLGYSGQFAGGVEKHDLSARLAVRF